MCASVVAEQKNTIDSLELPLTIVGSRTETYSFLGYVYSLI